MGLVRYPGVLASANGSRNVTAECADNAKPIAGPDLRVSCLASGEWSGIPPCKCNTGYRAVTLTPEKKICEG